MMTHAYQEIYLSKAMSALGEALDYAVNDCGIAGQDFMKMLIGSSICSRLENGEPAYLAGKSGIELVRDCVYEVTGKELSHEAEPRYGRTAEYWCGWSLAYYQWQSSRKYSEIFSAVSFEELLSMYPTLHEADITKFADVMDRKIKEAFPETKLKRMRRAAGLSQSELAVLSGVSTRSIQMYEQRNKDINRAVVSSVNALAKALGCTIEDLLEK